MSYKHRAPNYQLTLGGQDITPKVNPRLLQLTLSEARSEEADMLDITLDDHDGKLEIPPKGVMLKLALGYRGVALIDKGSFIVDEVSHNGPPDVLTIRARSAELTHDLRRRRSQSWHDKTLGSIVKSIASNNALAPRIDPELSNITIGHIDQSNESDIAFITRLARHFDAVATVKNGALIFLKINDTRTSNNEELPTITIKRNQTTGHSYTSADRDSYTGVRATYENISAATRNTVLVGTDENVKELPDIYAKKDEAEKAAKAECQRIERGVATLRLPLAFGMPDLMPQSIVKVTGFKSEIDAITWLAVKVTHSLAKDKGLLTDVELEVCSQKTELGSKKKGSGEGSFWK